MKPEENHVSQAFNWRKQVMKFYKCHIRRFIRSVGKAVFVIMLVFITLSETGWAATYMLATCSASDVASAISNASGGDMVIVPAGECTLTTDNNITIDKQITLKGNGIDSTIITTSGTSFRPVVNINAAKVVVRDSLLFQLTGRMRIRYNAMKQQVVFGLHTISLQAQEVMQ